MPKIFTLGDIISEISSEITLRKEEYSIITEYSEDLVKNKITAQQALEGCDALILSSPEKQQDKNNDLLKYKEFFEAAKKMGIPILGTRKGKVFVECLEQLDKKKDDYYFRDIDARIEKYNKLSYEDKRAPVYSNIIDHKGQLMKNTSEVDIKGFLRLVEHQQRQKEIIAAGKSALQKADKVGEDGKQAKNTDPISPIKHSNSIGGIKPTSGNKEKDIKQFADEAVQKELQEKVARLEESSNAKLKKQNSRARDKTFGSLEAKYKNTKKKEQKDLIKKAYHSTAHNPTTNTKYVFEPIKGAIEEGYEAQSFAAVSKMAIVGYLEKNQEIQTMQDLEIKSETLPYSQFDRFFSKQSKQLFRTENAVNRDKKIQYAQDMSYADAVTFGDAADEKKFFDNLSSKKDFTESLKNIDDLWGEAKQGAEKFLADKDGLVIAGTNTDSADRILATQALIHVAREKKIPLLGLEKGHQLLENLSELSDKESKNRVRQCIEEAKDISKSWERASKWATEATVDEKSDRVEDGPLNNKSERNVALKDFLTTSQDVANKRLERELKNLDMSNIIKVDNGRQQHAVGANSQQRTNQNNILQR